MPTAARVCCSVWAGTVSQNLTTLAMDKEYKLTRARRKDARGTEECAGQRFVMLDIYMRETTCPENRGRKVSQ